MLPLFRAVLKFCSTNRLFTVIVLKLSDFEPISVINLFLLTTGVTSPNYLRNTIQFLLMLYQIIRLSKGLFCIDVAKRDLKAVHN